MQLEMTNAFLYLETLLRLAIQGWKGQAHIRMSGSRWSAKTKSGQIQILKALLVSDITVQVAVYKYNVKKAKAIFKEFLDTMKYYKIEHLFKVNMTDRVITSFNGNQIMCMGYKSNKNEKQGALGEFRSINPDLLICLIDEIPEWSNSNERSLVHQAIGAGKLTIYMDTANPWSEFNWWVSECIKAFPFNESVMSDPNQSNQFNIVKHKWDEDNKSMDVEIYHYTNHNVNSYLKEEQHTILRKEWNIDPDMARVVDWGMPGIEKGAVYSYQAPMVRDYTPIERPNTIWGGMDWINSNNSLVVLFATGYETYDEIVNIRIEEAMIFSNDERYYFNSLEEDSWTPKQHPELHRDVVRFFKMCKAKHAKDYVDRVEIGIDNACEEAMNAINAALDGQGLDTQFLVHKATKKKIKERIDTNKQAMGRGILKINPRLTPILGAIEGLKWEEKTSITDPREKTIQRIIDINDALDYLMSKKASKIRKDY